MRLLYNDGYGGFGFHQFYKPDIPPYAILSHTWGADEDEVSLGELERFRNSPHVLQEKPGYRKLQFCARQAAADSLRHFWVDTCCIDQRSMPELSESINSMYRWYQEAVRCYVLLSDFVMHGAALDTRDWESFRRCRWFTRSWTLQELLAANQADFYDANGIHLGNKCTLAEWIQRVTHIPQPALLGQSLWDFGVEEILTWAKHRKAKREEDGAYSLLGIFEVSMPPVYGEGIEKAYIRLLKEVESDNSLQVHEKYSQYLPSTATPGHEEMGVPTLHITPGYTHAHRSETIEQNSQAYWDAGSGTWLQTHWSEEHQRHYRKQFIPGMRTRSSRPTNQ